MNERICMSSPDVGELKEQYVIDSISLVVSDKVGLTSRLKRVSFEATVPTWAQSATRRSSM